MVLKIIIDIKDSSIAEIKLKQLKAIWKIYQNSTLKIIMKKILEKN